jgi:DNA-binding PadR family transcriptional regulator
VRALSTFDLEEVLEVLDLEVTRKDMVVLGALLKAQKDPSDYIDFQTIREQLAKNEGSRKGKDPLIYRSLSKLEKDGFLKIDKSGHTHGYNSSISLMERALENLMAKKLESLEKDIEDADKKMESMSQMDSDALASRLIDISTGKKEKDHTVFAQGWDNILRLHDEKIASGLKKGDVVRVSLQWLSQTDYMDPKRMKMSKTLIERGVEFRALDHDRTEKEFRGNMRDFLIEVRNIGKVGYRILPRKDSTYQFMARNNEGIILIVSESPLSATWIPRTENPELVDSAIIGFDSDYEKGKDILDYED